jgi:hypothetical protein
MDDLNKSPLTCDVTSAVALWLDGMGFKPVETEVGMPWIDVNEKGWIADLAGVIFPTQTELINLKLLRKGPHWSILDKDGKWEKNPAYEEWAKERDTKQRLMTCLVEVKTTRADFLGDRKWNLHLPTDLAYLAYPKGLVDPSEWPSGWGILEFHNGSIRQRRFPFPGQTTSEQQRDVILSIAIRRDHHTRYARHREFNREHRERDKQEKIQTHLGRMTRAICSIVEGKRGSVKECLEWHGVKNLNEWAIEELQPLWGIKKPFSDPNDMNF